MFKLSILVAICIFASHAMAESTHTSFKLLKANIQPLTLQYFKGTENDRCNHALSMHDSGFEEAEKALNRHKSEIPTGYSVLEIGPFFNPLGNSLESPWVVWEMDQASAIHILHKSPETTVFQVDLNSLRNDKDWSRFLDENKKVLAEKNIPAKFGAIILSSVLNYVDYRKILEQTIPLLKRGGLLIIANTNAGDKNMMRNEPLPSVNIIGFLLSAYPGLLEFLPGSGLIQKSLSGPPMIVTADLAIRLKRPIANNSCEGVEDSYQLGHALVADMLYAPWEYKYPKSVRSEDTARGLKKSEEWRRSGQPNNIASFIWETRKLIYGILEKKDVHEALSFMDGPRGRDLRFIPERDLLKQALEISDVQERTSFLISRLTELYRRMCAKNNPLN